MIKRTLAASVAALSLSVAAAHAVPSFEFIVDGDTFTENFSFTNTSDAGEQLTRFSFTLPAGLCFDTDMVSPGCNTSAGTPFNPLGGTDVITGLNTVSAPDVGTVLDLTFTDFDPTETFTFELDVDFVTPGSATVFGNDLIGTMAFADFSDGQRLFGTFAAIAGNPDASGFVAQGIIDTPPVPLPAGLPLILAGLGAFGVVRLRQRKAG